MHPPSARERQHRTWHTLRASTPLLGPNIYIALAVGIQWVGPICSACGAPRAPLLPSFPLNLCEGAAKRERAGGRESRRASGIMPSERECACAERQHGASMAR